jgi:hypothetical protein
VYYLEAVTTIEMKQSTTKIKASLTVTAITTPLPSTPTPQCHVSGRSEHKNQFLTAPRENFPLVFIHRRSKVNMTGISKDFHSKVQPIDFRTYGIKAGIECHILEWDLDLLIGTRRKVILAGHFNAKHVTWRSRLNNAVGQYLLNHYYENNCIISVLSQLTHFPESNPARAEILEFA